MMKWLITITVMLAAIIEIIDSTIVNVVLHDMSGSLGASTEEISWVVTSYVVAAAVCMPLTGFLVTRIGRRRLLLINILGFMVASVMCGFAVNLDVMVICRLFQGVFGASLVPLSQYILRDTFPPEEQVRAMAIWGVGIMAAPVLGPTLGGYIADHLAWRWIFFINVPVCIIAAIMTFLFIKETATKKLRVDYLGLVLMVVTVASLQVFLDQGNTKDWFESNFILILCGIAVVGTVVFIIRGLYQGQANIINLYIFCDRNYALSCILLVLYTSSIFGLFTLQPMIMEGFANYTPLLAGMNMAPRGFAAAISMIVVAPMSKRLDLRVIILLGVVITAYGTWLFAGLSLDADEWAWMYPGIVQGFGMGLFFVPVSTLALSTIRQDWLAEGSGVFSFFRNLGTAIGISTLITVFTRLGQASWNSLSGNFSPSNARFIAWQQHFPYPHAPLVEKMAIAQQTVAAQSGFVAFTDASYLAVMFLVACVPFVFMLKKSTSGLSMAGH